MKSTWCYRDIIELEYFLQQDKGQVSFLDNGWKAPRFYFLNLKFKIFCLLLGDILFFVNDNEQTQIKSADLVLNRLALQLFLPGHLALAEKKKVI